MKKLRKQRYGCNLIYSMAICAVVALSSSSSLASPNKGTTRTVQDYDTKNLISPGTEDIKKLIQYYEETSQALLNSISGLTDEQLQFKPNQNTWSISQCLEHIVLSEKMIFGMIQQQLKKDPELDANAQRSQTDQDIIKTIVDRSQKFQAPEALQPTGLYKNTADAWEDFSKERKVITEYIKSADIAKLRGHLSKYPTGIADGYQSLLFLAAHTARHTAQIQEVKANPNFPK